MCITLITPRKTTRAPARLIDLFAAVGYDDWADMCCSLLRSTGTRYAVQKLQRCIDRRRNSYKEAALSH